MRIRFTVLAILISSFSLSAFSQQVKEPSISNKEWVKNYQPFQIVGNLYYVGTYDLACYLITTPEGHILINTGTAASDSMIRNNIKKLGFEVKDIKFLLTNQVHFDHVGAMASLKKSTGARLAIQKEDAPVLADGGVSDYYFKDKVPVFQPVKADYLINDKDRIALGDMELRVLHHPGHTKGSVSYMVRIHDQGHNYRVLIANIPTIIIEKKFSQVTDYPGMAKDYAYTLNAMKDLDFDIWVAAHASQFDLHTKHKEGDAYNPAAFIDKEGYLRRINKIKKEYDEMMASE